MRTKITSFLTSRRFWALVASIAVVALKDKLPLNEEQITQVVMAIGAWIVGESLRSSETFGKIVRSVAMVAMLSLAGSGAYAQLDLNDVYSPYQPIEIKLKTPIVEGGKLTSIWEIPDASIREVGADKLHVWAKPGKYLVTATVLVTKTIKVDDQDIEVLVPNTFQKHRAEFTVIGLTPGPTPVPPGPTPPTPSVIPEDEFDNIGRRIDQWIRETVPVANQHKRIEMAAAYKAAADRISLNFNIAEANQIIAEARNRILQPQAVADSWAIVGQRINQDASGRNWVNKNALANYYRAMSIGTLGGVN